MSDERTVEDAEDSPPILLAAVQVLAVMATAPGSPAYLRCRALTIELKRWDLPVPVKVGKSGLCRGARMRRTGLAGHENVLALNDDGFIGRYFILRKNGGFRGIEDGLVRGWMGESGVK